MDPEMWLRLSFDALGTPEAPEVGKILIAISQQIYANRMHPLGLVRHTSRIKARQSDLDRILL